MDCYKQLANAIEEVGSAVVYEEYKNIPVVDADEVPLALYWVRDTESGQVWTNHPLWAKMNMEQIQDEIAGREQSEAPYPFFYGERAYEESSDAHYNTEQIFASTYENDWYTYIPDLMIGQFGVDSIEYVVAMNPTVWDNSVYMDMYGSTYKNIYGIHMPHTLTYLVLLIGGCVGTAIFFIASIVMIGRRDRTKVRYAGPITSRIPIEGLLLIMLGAWIAYGATTVFALDAEVSYQFGQHPGEMMLIFVAMLIFAALAVWTVLTLVAKGKSKNMGANSWFGRAGKGILKGSETSAFTRKCPIEVMLLIFLVCWIIYAVIIAVLFDGVAYYGGIAALICVCVALAGAIFLAMWHIVTLVHKVKSKNFKTNSIIGKCGGGIVRGVKNAYRNRKVTGKLVLCSIGFAVISLLLIGLAFRTYVTGAWIFLLIVFWIVVIVLLMKKCMQKQRLKEGIHEIAGGNLEYQIEMGKMTGDELDMARDLNNLKDGMETAVERMMKSERMKTDLITNVSHDLKTPLTSIINYVDILKKEEIQDEKIRGYINILEQKSLRLKNLTEDLMEAAKISSGNITLEIQNINLKQLLYQTNGEFEEKFARRNLSLVCTLPESDVYIKADGRRMWRVIENLYNNAAKYAQPYSRVYVDGKLQAGKVILIIKNVSEAPLNISADELMERFVRGDVARNTEGSGLGLEIARNLTIMQKGTFEIQLDGDLFKVVLTFDAV
ncbi:MAG: HAMP domain-containing histidine kinase [Eubacterium sp.]|nr:HAMP domain-containing histidine kinase [Eubacterium sp.]